MAVLPERLFHRSAAPLTGTRRAPAPAPVAGPAAASAPVATRMGPASPFRWWTARAVALDLAVAVVAVNLAVGVRFEAGEIARQPVDNVVMAPLLAAVWLLALVFRGADSRGVSLYGIEEAPSIARAGVVRARVRATSRVGWPRRRAAGSTPGART